jgi:cell division septal protein FtsQ
MSVKAPSERNFRRARTKPARRARFRPHVSMTFVRRTVSLALLVFGAYQAVALAFTTPLLRVNRIAVRGNVRLSSGEVQALVEDLRGTSILRLDLDAFRSRLIESPWVADVALRRVLPSTIEVFVSERRPVGLCRLGQDLYLVDEAGTIIDQFGPRYAEFDLPIIDGLLSTPDRRGKPQGTIDPQRADLAARAIAAIGRSPALARRLSQVDVTNPHDAVVLIEGDPALLHLGEDRFLERLQDYVEVAGALRERMAALREEAVEIDYVDLRFGQLVYVRPAAEGRRASRPARGRPPMARQF